MHPLAFLTHAPLPLPRPLRSPLPRPPRLLPKPIHAPPSVRPRPRPAALAKGFGAPPPPSGPSKKNAKRSTTPSPPLEPPGASLDASPTHPTDPNSTPTSTPSSTSSTTPAKTRDRDLAIAFTCPCGSRVSKSFSRVAYEKGVVIITCDACDKRHLVADNLGYFSHFHDGRFRVEEAAKRAGTTMTRVGSWEEFWAKERERAAAKAKAAAGETPVVDVEAAKEEAEAPQPAGAEEPAQGRQQPAEAQAE